MRKFGSIFFGLVLSLSCVLYAAAETASLSLASVSPQEFLELQAFLNSRDYSPTPGDIFTFSAIVGEQYISYDMVLQPHMTLDVPYIGIVSAQGKTYAALRTEITERFKKKVPVDFADFSFKSPVRFEVFVSGLVKNPGPVFGSAIRRAASLVADSGGIREGGSQRAIRLIHRDGGEELVDLVAYRQFGDESKNPFIRRGDRIVVPQAERLVTVTGAVNVPGTYELADGEELEAALAFAGGFAVKAERGSLAVTRFNSNGRYTLLTVAADSKDFRLQHGDTVTVRSAIENPDFVLVEGAFYGKANDGVSPVQVPSRSQSYAVPGVDSGSISQVSVDSPAPIYVRMPWYPGMNLYDLMRALGGPTPYAEASQSAIFRADGKKESFDPLASWRNPDSGRSLALEPGDRVVVPMRARVVVLAGYVNAPKAFPYTEGATLETYLRQAGGIAENGSLGAMVRVDIAGRELGPVDLSYAPLPEDIILVKPKPAAAAAKFFSSPGFSATLAATAFVSAIVTFATTLIDFYAKLK